MDYRFMRLSIFCSDKDDDDNDDDAAALHLIYYL